MASDFNHSLFKELATSNGTRPKIVKKNPEQSEIKIINRTLRDISRGLTRHDDEESDKKTNKSIRAGARTIMTMKSRNKKTTMNATFTPKTHKLLDVLRDSIVNKLNLEEKKKEKAYESSVGSSVQSIFQSHRMIENAIHYEYTPKHYVRNVRSLWGLIALILGLQISIYLIIRGIFYGLDDNFSQQLTFGKLQDRMFQNMKASFTIDLIQNYGVILPKFITFYFYFKKVESQNNPLIIPALNEKIFQNIAEIKNLSMLLQKDHGFFIQLIPDFFSNRTYFNMKENKVVMMDFLQAIQLFVSNMQQFLARETTKTIIQNFPFLLKNIQIFSFEFDSRDQFEYLRSNLIKEDKLKVIIIFSIISTVIITIFIYRIYSHIYCFHYLNDLLTMFVKINNEDIDILKNYFVSIASVYDLADEQQDPTKSKSTILPLENMPNNEADSKAGQKRGGQRYQDLKNIKIPYFEIIFLNLIFLFFILGANVTVVLLSHIFDKNFENASMFQQYVVDKFRYADFTRNLMLVYDNKTKIGLFDKGIIDLDKLIISELMGDEPGFEWFTQKITQNSVCEKENLRCEKVLNGILLKSIEILLV